MTDLVVIGGGPAGMSAALHAANGGCRVTLLEHRPELGGQYWRTHLGQPVTGRDAQRGETLRQEVLAHSGIEVRTRTSVWSAIYRDGKAVLRVVSGNSEEELVGERLIVATGAHDRVFPFPGWTTPGVMTAGGIQALLKGHDVLVGQQILLVGSGPFLLSVAAAVNERGADVTLVEANSLLHWVRHPWALLTNPKKFLDLVHYTRHLRGVVRQRGVVTSVEPGLSISIQHRGKTKTLHADAIGVGYGFTPDLSVLLSLGAQCAMDDGNLIVEVDQNQQTSLANVYAAGEVTGIGGVEASLVEGAIAGLSAAGVAVPQRMRRKRKHWQRFAHTLADVYRMPDWVNQLTTDTVVCRCEEVTVGKIDKALTELSASDPRTIKLFTRTGMGLCQGRFCAQSVAKIVAARTGVEVSTRDLLTQRPVVTPVALGVIADISPRSTNG